MNDEKILYLDASLEISTHCGLCGAAVYNEALHTSWHLQNERAPAPEYASVGDGITSVGKPAPEAASAFVSEVRPNPGNEKEACCEICGATLVCLSCGNHQSDPAASPSDAVTRALEVLFKQHWLNWKEDSTPEERVKFLDDMTAALRTFAGALREESDKACKVLYSDERSLVNRVLTKAISNLLPEVKP